MKKLILIIIFAGVLYIAFGCKKNNSHYSDKILEQLKEKLDELSDLDKNHSVTENNNDSITENDNSEIQFIEEESRDGSQKTIVIRPLGEVDDGDLNFASQAITDFFGYRCITAEGISIPESIYGEKNEIDAHKLIMEFNDRQYTTIYLTEEKLRTGKMELRGYTTLYGKIIVVRSKKEFMRETLIHEIGHTLGLEHCNDLTCVMAINNDSEDSGDFCVKCTRKINETNFEL